MPYWLKSGCARKQTGQRLEQTHDNAVLSENSQANKANISIIYLKIYFFFFDNFYAKFQLKILLNTRLYVFLYKTRLHKQILQTIDTKVITISITV